jgi:hypothetical protein
MRVGVGSVELRPWHEIALRDLPEGTVSPWGPLSQILLTTYYSFTLIFLWASGSLRHAAKNDDLTQSGYTTFRVAAWAVGKYLLLLGALTLAALTPALQDVLPAG